MVDYLFHRLRITPSYFVVAGAFSGTDHNGSQNLYRKHGQRHKISILRPESPQSTKSSLVPMSRSGYLRLISALKLTKEC